MQRWKNIPRHVAPTAANVRASPDRIFRTSRCKNKPHLSVSKSFFSRWPQITSDEAKKKKRKIILFISRTFFLAALFREESPADPPGAEARTDVYSEPKKRGNGSRIALQQGLDRQQSFADIRFFLWEERTFVPGRCCASIAEVSIPISSNTCRFGLRL